jgi:hypothetical protein
VSTQGHRSKRTHKHLSDPVLGISPPGIMPIVGLQLVQALNEIENCKQGWKNSSTAVDKV